MNKKKKILQYILIFIVLLSVGACMAMIYIVSGFGNAVLNTTKAIDEVKKEWREENINPIDSIKKGVSELENSRIIQLDSIWGVGSLASLK